MRLAFFFFFCVALCRVAVFINLGPAGILGAIIFGGVPAYFFAGLLFHTAKKDPPDKPL